MPSKNVRGLRATTVEAIRRSRKVPESLVKRFIEGRQRELKKALQGRNAIRRRADHDMRSVLGPEKRLAGGSAGGTMKAALRQAVRRVSSQKLVAPVVPGEIGGLLSYTLNFTPPYDYVMAQGDIGGGGNVRTADPRAGTINWNIEDETNDGLLHFGWVELGSLFFPPNGHRILSVRSAPSFNWSWWLASAGPLASVDCDIEVGLAGFKGAKDPWVEAAAIKIFQPFADGAGFQFDMGSATNAPLGRAIVDQPADLYLAFVRVTGVVGVGRPSPQTGGGGAVSGGKVRATVPSIAVEVEQEPLLSSL